MSFKMIYDKRNRGNLDKLADNTKIKAYQFYQYCIDYKIQILIYETIRTKEKQAQNVKKGVSKTMQSYHIVGQALDWVLVDSKGSALWNAYKTKSGLNVINYAKSIGFVSGHDWGWDSPHLQYEHKGYGTDTFGKDGLTIEQYNELKKLIQEQAKKINELESELANKLEAPKERAVGNSHKEGHEWVVAKGISDGSKPFQYATREQVFTMLNRMSKD